MKRVLELVRFVAIFGAVASLVLASGLYFASAVDSVLLVFDALRNIGRESTIKELIIGSVEQADALLVATGLMIVSIGLYSLFIGKIARLPAWLNIDSFESLKNKLLGVVVAALAVRFFSIAMEGGAGLELLYFGLAIGAVVLALAAYSAAGNHGAAPKASDDLTRK